MNILFIKHFFVGFIVSEIPRVSVFGHCPYSVTFPYIYSKYIYNQNIIKCSFIYGNILQYYNRWGKYPNTDRASPIIRIISLYEIFVSQKL